MQENNWNQQMNYGQQVPPPYPYGYREPERKGFAIASLVLGILSLVLCCFYGGFLGILGLIFGIVSLVKKESKMGMAIAGIITSSFGLIYGILMVMGTVLTFQYGMQNFTEEFYARMEEELQGEKTAESDLKQDDVIKVTEEDPFAEKSFVLEDNSVIYFNADGTFMWYRDNANHEDNYYVGTYDSYQAEFAESYIVTYLDEYGVTEEELADYYQRNKDSEFFTEENFTCLVLHNESAIIEGEEQFIEPYDTNYMGFYMDGYYDAVNMASGAYAKFTAR